MSRERSLLQGAILCAGLVPVGSGSAGAILGPALIQATSTDLATADSHFRYLSGLLLGIGLTAWSLLPRIDTAGPVFRALTGVVVIGGLCRLASLASVGAPSPPMLGGLVMELLVTPALAVWHWRFERRLTDVSGSPP
jgi:Domain of unknown function (DUF4345)